jgi:hypothetical protein
LGEVSVRADGVLDPLLEALLHCLFVGVAEADCTAQAGERAVVLCRFVAH